MLYDHVLSWSAGTFIDDWADRHKDWMRDQTRLHFSIPKRLRGICAKETYHGDSPDEVKSQELVSFDTQLALVVCA